MNIHTKTLTWVYIYVYGTYVCVCWGYMDVQRKYLHTNWRPFFKHFSILTIFIVFKYFKLVLLEVIYKQNDSFLKIVFFYCQVIVECGPSVQAMSGSCLSWPKIISESYTWWRVSDSCSISFSNMLCSHLKKEKHLLILRSLVQPDIYITVCERFHTPIFKRLQHGYLIHLDKFNA